MGGQSSKSEQRPIAKTKTEKAFEATQLDLANEQLGFFKDFLKPAGEQAIGEINENVDIISGLTGDQQQSFVDQIFGTARSAGQNFASLSEQEMENITNIGVLSDNDAALIDQRADEALEAGRIDIRGGLSNALEDIRQSNTTRLGLRPGDTPIVDRGGRIAEQAVRSEAQLASGLRAGAAQQKLDRPLQVSAQKSAQIGQQQGIQTARSDVLANLQNQAVANRLNLTGTASGAGVGQQQAGAGAQQSLRPTVVTESKSSGGGILAQSSRAVKEELGGIDTAEVLEAMNEIPVKLWRYLADPAAKKHVGTYAEDFRQAFGIGDGKTINLVDAVGLLMAAVQALTQRLEKVEA